MSTQRKVGNAMKKKVAPPPGTVPPQAKAVEDDIELPWFRVTGDDVGRRPTLREKAEKEAAELLEMGRKWVAAVQGEEEEKLFAPYKGVEGVEVFSDGKILCQTVKVLFPDFASKMRKSDSKNLENRQNARSFVAFLNAVGVPDELLFLTDDLLEARKPLKIVKALNMVALMLERAGYTRRWGGTNEPNDMDGVPSIDEQFMADYGTAFKATCAAVRPNVKKMRKMEVNAAMEDEVMPGKVNVNRELGGRTPKELQRIIEKELRMENPKNWNMFHACARHNLFSDVMGNNMIILKDQAVVWKNEKDVDGNTPLHLAAMHGAFSCIKTLVQNDVDVNAQNNAGDTALHLIAPRAWPDTIRYLLQRKCDPTIANAAGSTPLHIAAAEGDPETVTALIEGGAHIDEKDAGGNTSLHLACLHGNTEIAQILVNRGASFTRENLNADTPLSLACQSGIPAVVDVVCGSAGIRHGNKDGTVPLHVATLYQGPKVVSKLIDADADINRPNLKGETALLISALHDRDDNLELLIERGAILDVQRRDGWSPLFAAAWRGNELNVERLCKKACEVNITNSEGWTPLHAAADQGHTTIVKMLVTEFGADINALNKKGVTPLYRACMKNHVECVKVLLELGADPNMGKDFGWKPLHIAINNNFPEIVDILLNIPEVDANAVIKDLKHYTPLHVAVAAKESNPEIITSLIKRGVTREAKNSSGQTPLHLAVFWNKPDIVRLLVDLGCSVHSKNQNERTPLQLACYFNFEEVATFLAERMDVKLPEMGKGERVTYSSIPNVPRKGKPRQKNVGRGKKKDAEGGAKAKMVDTAQPVMVELVSTPAPNPSLILGADTSMLSASQQLVSENLAMDISTGPSDVVDLLSLLE